MVRFFKALLEKLSVGHGPQAVVGLAHVAHDFDVQNSRKQINLFRRIIQFRIVLDHVFDLKESRSFRLPVAFGVLIERLNNRLKPLAVEPPHREKAPDMLLNNPRCVLEPLE